ncbi:MAG: cytochrome b N-terminal domain-containing protein [Acidobacteriota bacterium]|nr:cytochrome b N-terminal domain-containing protein [Acidobacteriota bacterium]
MADHQENHAAAGKASGLIRWINARTGLHDLLHHALDEPIPGGAKLAYVFGSGLIFLFISQIVTGVFLAMYYVPSADHAHTTVAYMVKEVNAGAFLRSVHAYGSSAIIVVLMLHLIQTFFFGSYKGRRELLWVAGCVLLALMVGMAFTGYLLPWDQKAYFATTVGTNILSEVPLIGNAIKRLLRGGTEMGTLTLSRFFVLHVFLVPAAIFAFLALHIYLFRKAGAAGPVDEDPISPKQPTESFYPKQLIMDMGFALLILVVMGLLAHYVPVELGPKADASDTQYVPRPEWYYLPVFQYLKYWHGSSAVVGILVVPALLAVLLVGLPFFDRDLERRPWKRPVSIGMFSAVFLALGVLGYMSSHQDLRDPGIAAQIRRQHQEVEQFMRTPFEPETAGATLAATNVALVNPEAAAGKAIFEQQACNSCHGDNGTGTTVGPKLVGIGAKYDAQRLSALLKHPTPAMESGGMTKVEVKEDELQKLTAYMLSLK